MVLKFAGFADEGIAPPARPLAFIRVCGPPMKMVDYAQPAAESATAWRWWWSSVRPRHPDGIE